MGDPSSMVGAASVGASLFGGLGGSNISASNPSGDMNALLSGALGQGLSYSEGYNSQAINQQNTSLQAALDELNQAMTTTTNTMNNAFQTSQALQAPYRNAGYQALDQYQDSLHMNRATMGSQALSTALTNQVGAQQQVQGLQAGQNTLNQYYNTGAFDPSKLPNAPTLQDVKGKVQSGDISNYIKANTTAGPAAIYNYQGPTGGAVSGGNPYFTGGFSAGDPGGDASRYGTGIQTILGNQNIQNAVRDQLAQPILDKATQAYQNQQGLQNQFGQFLQNQFTPDQQNISLAYNRGLFNNLGNQKLY